MPERKKAGRRSNNEGCIRQRPNGLWEAQYIVACKPDGRPIRRSIYGQKKAEVRMKLRDILLSIERDEYIEPSHLTVGDWLEEWFRIYCLPHKKASTCTGYEEEIYLHLKPYIGRIPLQELKAQHVQAAINELVREGKASATVRKAHTILHAALEQAVINQMILRNPSEHTILPKFEQEEIRFFTSEEQKRFIEALPDSTAGRALYFILGTGLRMAELAGLRWCDIHGSSFTVKQTIGRIRDFSDDATSHLVIGIHCSVLNFLLFVFKVSEVCFSQPCDYTILHIESYKTYITFSTMRFLTK